MASTQLATLADFLDVQVDDKHDGSPRIIREARSVDHFVKIVLTVYNSSEHLVYRGQRSDWPLIPSVGRLSRHSRWLGKEQEALEEFKREAIPFLPFRPSNDWQWLAVAQHNRLPTRLLDWTKSPLAALWFAVAEPACDDDNAVVWAHAYEPSSVISSTQCLDSPFTIDSAHLYFPEHIFPHIQAQSSVFTIHPRHANRFAPFQETNDSALTKIVLQSRVVPDMRLSLSRLGVDPSFLFPGLGGLVSRIRFHHEMPQDEAALYDKSLGVLPSST